MDGYSGKIKYLRLAGPFVFLGVVVGILALLLTSGALPEGPSEGRGDRYSPPNTRSVPLGGPGGIRATSTTGVNGSSTASGDAEVEGTADGQGPKGASGDTTADSESPPATYVVKEGDTPWSIAEHLGVSVEELMALNGIREPTGLDIGTVLEVPVRSISE